MQTWVGEVGQSDVAVHCSMVSLFATLLLRVAPLVSCHILVLV